MGVIGYMLIGEVGEAYRGKMGRAFSRSLSLTFFIGVIESHGRLMFSSAGYKDLSGAGMEDGLEG